jgi:hypothetical protein
MKEYGSPSCKEALIKEYLIKRLIRSVFTQQTIRCLGNASLTQYRTPSRSVWFHPLLRNERWKREYVFAFDILVLLNEILFLLQKCISDSRVSSKYSK